ncbi:sensor histidine kinase [Echinicola sp. 20G]|uniref:sensor histidine kinase n=1 Tax=Echinicola sp. 20G TaxID=2781961 RepID=UPI00190FF3E2|nr:ATP-binding protein [Echinicola sp. 20G]
MEGQEFVNYILLAISLVLVLAVIIIVAVEVMRRKVIKEKMLNAELKLKHQTDLLHTVIRSQEEERRRVSDILHDDIGSKLTTIKLSLYQLSGNDSLELLNGLKELSEKVISRTRELSHAYSPLIVEKFGLEAGIHELLDEVLAGPRIGTRFKSDIEENLLDQETRLIIYRISQELINNTVKHAGAQEIKINISVNGEGLFYLYEDNGKGFDVEKSSDGIGMLNLQNRVDMMNGSLEVWSELGKGMKVTIKKSFDGS